MTNLNDVVVPLPVCVTKSYSLEERKKSNEGFRFCSDETVTSVDISAEVYNFKEANEVLENQVENCDVEKVKTEPELMNTKMVKIVIDLPLILEERFMEKILLNTTMLN